ncbi:hypothetical protein [Paenibacillus sp. KS-LC4]|uniref:hypothetical protein n=1 Tax=Paenibacillus sp. KS-LC4 TaxID=2979727 RepID=UPI0030D33897
MDQKAPIVLIYLLVKAIQEKPACLEMSKPAIQAARYSDKDSLSEELVKEIIQAQKKIA